MNMGKESNLDRILESLGIDMQGLLEKYYILGQSHILAYIIKLLMKYNKDEIMEVINVSLEKDKQLADYTYDILKDIKL